MSKLPREVIDLIEEKAKEIPYGNIHIELNESGNFVDVIISQRIRVMKNVKPRPGMVYSNVQRMG